MKRERANMQVHWTAYTAAVRDLYVRTQSRKTGSVWSDWGILMIDL